MLARVGPSTVVGSLLRVLAIVALSVLATAAAGPLMELVASRLPPHRFSMVTSMALQAGGASMALVAVALAYGARPSRGQRWWLFVTVVPVLLLARATIDVAATFGADMSTLRFLEAAATMPGVAKLPRSPYSSRSSFSRPSARNSCAAARCGTPWPLEAL